MFIVGATTEYVPSITRRLICSLHRLHVLALLSRNIDPFASLRFPRVSRAGPFWLDHTRTDDSG